MHGDTQAQRRTLEEARATPGLVEHVATPDMVTLYCAQRADLRGYHRMLTAWREEASMPEMKAGIDRFLQAVNEIEDDSRREVNDGLNVVEHWNSANDFIFFARRGEFSSNRREDQELSMLSLHLLQNCMVYVNTLMVQQVLARPAWTGRLTPRDLHALTPLFWGHVNPYGRFDLDMRTRLDLN